MSSCLDNFKEDVNYNKWEDVPGKTHNRIVLIGSGMVGQAFLFSAMNQGIAEEYGIIDVFHEVAVGNEMDLADAVPSLPRPCRVRAGGYELVKGADLIVICAGRPQKPDETRLEMVADNAKIMTKIANEVKANNFKGITLIAANPVDIMTQVYLKVTEFERQTVISSGCVLDTSRLQNEVAKYVGVTPGELNLFVLGEHGDSSVSTFAHASVGGCPIQQKLETSCDPSITLALALEKIHEKVFKRAYEIISRKRFTNYGVGACLARICRAILRNENVLLPVGTLLTGEYGEEGVVCSVPCIVGSAGVSKTYEFPLSDSEKARFSNSCTTLREIFNSLDI